MKDCIFCKIIAGQVPSAKVYEDENVFAFLDLSQVTPGHTLLIPKEHLSDIFDYTQDAAGQLFSYVPLLADALQKAFPDMKGLNLVNNNGEVAYQTVFHSHIHLIPRYSGDDGFKMHFSDNSKSYTQDEFQERARLISKEIGE